MIELDYIDRKRRLVVRYVELLILAPLFFFFLSCAFEGRNSDDTIAETLFNLPRHWRTIGWVGLLVTGTLYLTLARLTLYNLGKVRISEERIELLKGGRSHIFEVSQIKKMVFVKDVPFKADDRNDSQRASRFKFNYQGQSVDIELRTKSKLDFNQILSITKYWREHISGYREEYK